MITNEQAKEAMKYEVDDRQFNDSTCDVKFYRTWLITVIDDLDCDNRNERKYARNFIDSPDFPALCLCANLEPDAIVPKVRRGDYKTLKEAKKIVKQQNEGRQKSEKERWLETCETMR
jgi:hypothetical protein